MQPAYDVETIVDEKEEFQRVPRYPYVTFTSMKDITHSSDSKDVLKLRKSTWHLDVSGCHGNANALNNVKNRGCICIGSGNLTPMQHKEVIAWVAMETGTGVHPALRASAMDSKIAKAKEELKEQEPVKKGSK